MKKCIACMLLAGLVAMGCDDKKGGGAESSTKATDLPKLGLKANLPEGANISDAIGGTGHMVVAPGLVVTVTKSTDTNPQTLADAKEEAKMFSPTNLKEEKLADGFALTYQNKGSMGTNMFVNVRREIGGTAYWCSTTASTADQQTNALNVCKSLKK